MAENTHLFENTLRNTTKSEASAIAQTEIKSIVDAIPKISLLKTNDQDDDIDTDLDNIIRKMILEEREIRAWEKSARETKFDKIRYEISRLKRDLVKKGQSLSF